MVVVSDVKELSAAAAAKPERMRGFEEDDLRTQTGGLGGQRHDRGGGGGRGGPSSAYRFHSLVPLQPVKAGDNMHLAIGGIGQCSVRFN